MTKQKQEAQTPQTTQTKKELFWEIVRFLVVGSSSTIIDYFLFWLFDGVLFPWIAPTAGEGLETLFLMFATALGFCAGLMVNWFLSIRFVFRAVKNKEEASSKKSFLLFAAIGVVGLIMTEIGVVGLVAVLPEFTLFNTTAVLGVTWAKWLAKAVMTVIVLIWNYTCRKRLIFK